MSNYQTTRIWTETLEKLRMIYAMTGESQVSIVDRLVTAELSKLQEKTMSVLDDFFGPAETMECEECGVAENLVGCGSYDVHAERHSYYLCQEHYAEQKARIEAKQHPRTRSSEDELEDGLPPRN